MLLNHNRRDLENFLIAKAIEDSYFRKELIENPKIAIAREFGAQLPAEIDIKILEETDKELYIILPLVTKKI